MPSTQSALQGKKKKSGLLLTLFIITLLLPVAALITLAALLSPAFSDTPVAGAAVVNSTTTQQARQFIHRSQKKLYSSGQYVTLSINNREINSLIALVTHAVPQIRGKANISDQGINYAISVKLPKNPLSQYFSFNGQMIPSHEGVSLGTMQIGLLKLPSEVLDYSTEYLLNMILGDNQGSLLFQSAKALITTADTAFLHAEPPGDIKFRVENLGQRFSQYSSDMNLFADSQQTRHYYQFLHKKGEQFKRQKRISLVHFLNPLFKESARLSINGDARAQNRAAILALGVYLGSANFEKIVGDLDSSSTKSHKLYRVGLATRQDLRLHFVFSAVFKVLADQGFSLAAGEFKELLDTQKGGSGFSFVDLAADRAGAQFAEIATTREPIARRLQQLFVETMDEAELFPPIKGLPEGISETRFNRKFRDLNSPAYLSMEKNIDHRLQQLPLYKLLHL